MMAECTIRPIDYDTDPGDLRSFLTEGDAKRLDLCRNAVMDGDAFILVAVCGDRIVGWVVTHLSNRDDVEWAPDGDTTEYLGGQNGYLENIEVIRELRGRGIGSMLLSEAERRARLNGKNRLWLHVRDQNAVALEFYERHGWRYQKTIDPTWTDPGKLCRVYRKDLQGSA